MLLLGVCLVRIEPLSARGLGRRASWWYATFYGRELRCWAMID